MLARGTCAGTTSAEQQTFEPTPSPIGGDPSFQPGSTSSTGAGSTDEPAWVVKVLVAGPIAAFVVLLCFLSKYSPGRRARAFALSGDGGPGTIQGTDNATAVASVAATTDDAADLPVVYHGVPVPAGAAGATSIVTAVATPSYVVDSGCAYQSELPAFPSRAAALVLPTAVAIPHDGTGTELAPV